MFKNKIQKTTKGQPNGDDLALSLGQSSRWDVMQYRGCKMEFSVEVMKLFTDVGLILLFLSIEIE